MMQIMDKFRDADGVKIIVVTWKVNRDETIEKLKSIFIQGFISKAFNNLKENQEFNEKINEILFEYKSNYWKNMILKILMDEGVVRVKVNVNAPSLCNIIDLFKNTYCDNKNKNYIFECDEKTRSEFTKKDNSEINVKIFTFKKREYL